MKTSPDSSYLVRDDVTGDWVIVAPGRRKRPEGKKPSGDPFAPSRLENERILATYGSGANRVTSIENAFPVFRPNRGITGRQEILVETTRGHWESLLHAFAERFRVLRTDPKIKYLQAFKNEGATAGASQPHPHAQIFATSFVPDHIRDEAKRRRSAVKRLGHSAHAHCLSLATPERIIFSDTHVIAYANPAARFAYEVRVMTRMRRDNIVKTTPAERRSLAKALSALLPLVNKKKFGFNLYFHDVLDESDEHFEIRFTPRSNTWGGFELDAGVYVNPVPAEDAAQEYRDAKK
ncbi:MAG: hypothetical protein WC787_04000 [Patescibacteria group bacterium]|jgi:galactose-1-phosphate uridylyltransferase